MQRAEPLFAIYPYALGDRNGEATFYVTRDPDDSSCLEPNLALAAHYTRLPTMLTITSRQKIELRRFDSLYPSVFPAVPHFLQIDVQGFEYQVLEGFGGLLDQVLCVQLESQFKPLYLGQKTLCELKPYLESRGFMLRDLQLDRKYFGGEAFQADLFFVRDRRMVPEESRSLIELWETVCQMPAAVF